MKALLPALIIATALISGCCSTCQDKKAAAADLRAQEEIAPADDAITPADEFQGSVSLPL